MTPKEALDKLSIYLESQLAYEGTPDEFQALKIIIDLVAKAEPMKVDLTTECDWFYNCPNCKGYNVMERSSYCDDCGQALDWSEK